MDVKIKTPDVRTISTSFLLRLLLLFLFPELNEAEHTQHLLNDADDNRHYSKTHVPPRLSSTLPMCLQNIVLYLRRVQLYNTDSDVQLLLFSLKRPVSLFFPPHCSLFPLSAAHRQHLHSGGNSQRQNVGENNIRVISSFPSIHPRVLPSILPQSCPRCFFLLHLFSSSFPSLVSSSPLLSLLACGHY